jgi:hypothetical protein
MLRSLLAFGLGPCIALATFGLFLGLAWAWPAASWPAYKLVTALLCAAISFCVAGASVAGLAGNRPLLHGTVFGLTFGAVSFTYLLGPSSAALAAVPIAVMLALAGAALVPTLAFRWRTDATRRPAK